MPARYRLLLPATALLLGLTACASTPALEPTAAAPTAAAPAPSAAAASTGASASTEAPATTNVPASAKVPAATKTTRMANHAPECPSAKALERLVDLPDGWTFIPSSVECWKGWALATPKRTSPADGNYLFRYTSSKGWKYHSQGSAFDCEPLGIKEPSPICAHY